MLLVLLLGSSFALARTPQETSESESLSESPIVLAWERFHGGEEWVRPQEPEQQRLLGSVLGNELSCAACHSVAARLLDAPKRGPRLDGIGARREAHWLREFLAAPSTAKPGTTMPDGLVNAADGSLDALVALLLASDEELLTPIPPSKDDDPTAASPQRGRELFEQRGCIACHESDGAEAPYRRVPFRALERRYTLLGLTQFLREPLTINPHARMPDLQLPILEAADIASYLLSSHLGASVPVVEPVSPDGRLVEQGRHEFVSRGCANCHQLQDLRGELQASPLTHDSPLSRGCWQPRESDAAESIARPSWPLSTAQQEALRVALTASQPTGPSEDDARQANNRPRRDQLDARLLSLNCVSCHWRLDDNRERHRAASGDVHEFFATSAITTWATRGGCLRCTWSEPNCDKIGWSRCSKGRRSGLFCKLAHSVRPELSRHCSAVGAGGSRG
ncbi:MAG: c-type cytochrome [Pirellulaceae bacterium]